MGRPKGSKNKIHKQFCPKGHDTFVVGRNKKGMCRQCDRERKHTDKVRQKSLEYYNKNKDIIRLKRLPKWVEYNKAHPLTPEQKERKKISFKEWSKLNRSRINALKIKSGTNRNLRIVAWTDWNSIKAIYGKCPEDFQVDHIIPLQGKLISGLHVSWNLQHLPIADNRIKFNKIDLLEASEWYGKILEQAGLK